MILKKILSLIMAFCMVVLGFSVINFSSFAKAENVSLTTSGKAIANEDDFKNMESSGDYYLTNDIQLTSYDTSKNFSGTLDGNGYTISIDQTTNQNVYITNDANILTANDGVLLTTVQINKQISSLKYKYELAIGEDTYTSNSITLNEDIPVGEKTLSNTVSSLFPNLDYSLVSNQNNFKLIIEEIKTNESQSLNIDEYYGVNKYQTINVVLEADGDNATMTVPSLTGYNGAVVINFYYNGETYIFVLDNFNSQYSDITISKSLESLEITYETEGNNRFYKTETISDGNFSTKTLSEVLQNGASFGLGSLNNAFVNNVEESNIKHTDYVKTFVNNTNTSMTLRLNLEAQINGEVRASSSEFSTVLAPGKQQISFYIGGDENRSNGLFSNYGEILLEPQNYTMVVNNYTQIELNVENPNNVALRYQFEIVATLKDNNATQLKSKTIVDYIGKAEDQASKKELISFTYSSLFGYIQPNLYNFTVENEDIVVSTICENGGLFNRLTNATIKNLGIKNWTTVTSNSSVGLLANSAEGCTIENVFVDGYIEIESNSSILAGGMIGSSTGTKIKNCYSTAQIVANCYGLTASQIVVGGIVGKMIDGEISNSFVFNSTSSTDFAINAQFVKKDLDSELMPVGELFVGGLVGAVWKGKVINNFIVGNINGSTVNNDITPNIGLLFGEIGSGVYLPYDYDVAYNHVVSNSIYNLVGAETTYSLKNCTQLSNSNIFKEKSTFTSSSLWDTTFYPWNFDDKWYAKSGADYIVLQPFESFTVTLSYSDYVIPTINGNEVAEASIKYGETVTISAKIADNQKLLYKISAIQKDGKNLTQESDYTFQMTSLTSGLYSIISDSIDYNLIIESSSIEQGGVKIKGAQKDLEKIEINVTNGGLYEFEAVPAKNYGFVEWVWVTIEDGKEVLTTAKLGLMGSETEDTRSPARQSVAIRFTENNLGNAYLYVPMPTYEGQKYTLRAVFTSQICDMTIRTNLSTENCATIYVNGVPYNYSSDNNYLYLGTISKDADVIIKIEVKDGYEFKGWQAGNTSDPIETFLKDSSSTDEEIVFRTSNQNFLLIASIEKSENSGGNLTWLWWTLGGIGGAGIIGLAIWLIIKKARSADFMSNY